MKIPTLVGIALLITFAALAVLYFFYYNPKSTQVNNIQITDLQPVNISDTSVTIVWQTSIPVKGQVIYSESETLDKNAKDNRDRGMDQDRMVHFVTINNLKPATKYSYKIKNNDEEYSEKASTFTTASEVQKTDDLTFSFIKPLKGTILNTNLNPISESLVFVKIPGATTLATFSSTAGNFILPLKTVMSEDLKQIFVIPPSSPAQLTIIKGNLKSDVKILISEANINLPPITIGSNLDLTKFKVQPITNITLTAPPSTGMDFNNDGAINSLDLAVLKQAADPKSLRGSSGKSKFDINLDEVVDQKDVDVFSKALGGN